jgi:hypothetical protein
VRTAIVDHGDSWNSTPSTAPATTVSCGNICHTFPTGHTAPFLWVCKLPSMSVLGARCRVPSLPEWAVCCGGPEDRCYVSMARVARLERVLGDGYLNTGIGSEL